MEHARHLLDEDAHTRDAMRRFTDGWLGRVRIGTSMTVLMYVLPPLLRQLKTDHPQLEINLKAGLTATTLRLLKENALDLGLCAMPITDPAFETVALFRDDLVAVLPVKLGDIPKTVTPAFMSSCDLILGNRQSALRRMVAEWLALAGSVAKPVMEFDNVVAIKSVVAVGLGSSILPGLSLGEGHVAVTNTTRPIKPRLSRQIALVKLRGKRSTEAVSLASAALLSLRRSG
jgi:DNA-binding transcriptional LysR family regulator